MKSKIFLPLIAIVSLLTGFGLGILYKNNYKYNISNDGRDLYLNNKNYKFIEPLLDSSLGSASFLPRSLQKMHNDIEKLIAAEIKSTDLQTASIYFRDLKNGPRFVINGEEKYSPASLLKVPVLIAYYKKSMTDPDILESKVDYNTPLDTFNFPKQTGEDVITLNQTYSIDELLNAMIIHSDNEATQLLYANIRLSEIDRVYLDFSVPLPHLLGPRDPFISVDQYANFFRILYNGTYLNHNLSNQALSLLNQTTYSDGFKAGVPEGIQVASKFGIEETDNLTQMHECGIIYHQTRPFLLCIMTKGNNLTAQTKLITTITSNIYRHIDSL